MNEQKLIKLICFLLMAALCLCGCQEQDSAPVVIAVEPQNEADGAVLPEAVAPTPAATMPLSPSPAPSATPLPTPTQPPAVPSPTPTPRPTPTASPEPAPAPTEESREQRPSYSSGSILDMTNRQREANGLSALRSSSALDEAAAVRAKELATLFSHTRPDGSECFTVSPEAYAENIAYGMNVSRATIMEGWMNSPGHRANILNSSYGSLGVGEYSEGGYDYYVQLFGY